MLAILQQCLVEPKEILDDFAEKLFQNMQCMCGQMFLLPKKAMQVYDGSCSCTCAVLSCFSVNITAWYWFHEYNQVQLVPSTKLARVPLKTGYLLIYHFLFLCFVTQRKSSLAVQQLHVVRMRGRDAGRCMLHHCERRRRGDSSSHPAGASLQKFPKLPSRVTTYHNKLRQLSLAICRFSCVSLAMLVSRKTWPP